MVFNRMAVGLGGGCLFGAKASVVHGDMTAGEDLAGACALAKR